MNKELYPIDFVIPWVDGNDPEWMNRKEKVLGSYFTDERENRYRDWGLLRYWFRGIEQFAPWVRYIWFICDQEPPKWLNSEHSKLKIVRHEDYLPSDYRPAFSSRPIELNLHRIDGLSEHFVYFNDDTFLIAPIRREFYFYKKLPRDYALINPMSTVELSTSGRDAHISPMYLYDLEYLNCDYDFHECLRNNVWKWLNIRYGKFLFRNLMFLPYSRFIGFIEAHLPQPFLKSSFEKAWIRDFDILDMTSRHHIRHDHDVNQWLIRQQQLAEGAFIPKKPLLGTTFAISDDSKMMHDMIRKQMKPVICLNDTKVISEADFKRLKIKLRDDFELILKESSSFEKER